MDFLLRLRSEALAPFAEQCAALANPAPLKIGIHIRVSDRQLVRKENIHTHDIETRHPQTTTPCMGIQIKQSHDHHKLP